MNFKSLAYISVSFFFLIVVPYHCYRKSLRKSYSSSASFSNVKIAIGASSDIGSRASNEDAHLVSCGSFLMTGVFDGHCGSEASRAAAQLFPRVFKSFPTHAEVFYKFVEVNDEIKKLTFHGTTACCVFVENCRILSANCGDSRSILCRGGRVLELSHDFKPQRPSEKARITTYGGYVRYVNLGITRMFPGGLSVSRALGDRDYALISGTPEIYSGELSYNDEFYVIACDGIFDVMSSADVVQFIRMNRRDAQIKGIEQALSMQNVDDTFISSASQIMLNFYGKARMKFLGQFDDFRPPEKLLYHADALAAKILAQRLLETALMRNTTDNVTCVVGLFRWPNTPHTAREWRAWGKGALLNSNDVVQEQPFEITHSANDESTEFWGLDRR